MTLSAHRKNYKAAFYGWVREHHARNRAKAYRNSVLPVISIKKLNCIATGCGGDCKLSNMNARAHERAGTNRKVAENNRRQGLNLQRRDESTGHLEMNDALSKNAQGVLRRRITSGPHRL